MLKPVGLFAQHPLQGILHSEPTALVEYKCRHCEAKFTGPVRKLLYEYREHVLDKHMDILEDCGCCGGYHLPEFTGDCREDWERF